MTKHTRRAFISLLLAAGGAGVLLRRQIFRPPGLRRFPRLNLPRPTPEQLAWQDMEMGLFIHIGMPTCTGKVGVVGDPRLFDPRALDVDQWLDAAQAMGAKYAVLVAKHVDGFLCWQTDLYAYGVRQSPWKGGKGDLVADFVDACRRRGIAPGLYASVADNTFWHVRYPGRVRGAAADSPKQQAYNRMVEAMVRELCSRYGELAELWFDGDVLPPQQGGPDLEPILCALQPHAVALQGPTASIRLSGGETGTVGYPCWATARRRGAMGQGHPEGSLWLPVECDAPLRVHQWFWRPGQEHTLRSPRELVDMYYRSVGRNGNLLLNASPDRDGRVPEEDMQRYTEFGKEIRRRFASALAETGGAHPVLEVPAGERIDHVALMENIATGERIRRYRVEGLLHADRWETLCEGTAVGHKRIQRFKARRVGRVRLRILDSAGRPGIRRLAVYGVGG